MACEHSPVPIALRVRIERPVMNPEDGEKIYDACMEANHLNAEGLLQLKSGNMAAGVEMLDRGLAIVEKLPLSETVLRVTGALCGNRATAHMEAEEHVLAGHLLEIQLQIATTLDDKQSIGNALNSFAICCIAANDFDLAEKAFDRRIALARGIGDRKGEGNTMNNLAQLYIRRKHFGPAIALLNERVALAREIGDKHGEATSWLGLGQAYSETNRPGCARDAYGRAKSLMLETGDPRLGMVNGLLAELP